MKILRDISAVRPFVDAGPILGSALVALDDPLLFKYPVSYMSEPGGRYPNDPEIAAFPTYIPKGGFMIFDDFREVGWGGDWTNLRQEVARALPNGKWVQLTGAEPIFDSFFKIEMKSAVEWPSTSAYGQQSADVLGHLPGQRSQEAPDPHGQRRQRHRRVLAVVRHLASCRFQRSNETYKLGVNYIIYALTH